MWQGLRTNDLQMVSTDHCPFCMKGQKELGKGDFRAIPNGIGSIEHRMDLLYQGVVTGELTLERWVELTSTTPARMFGLYGTKGVIAPGADADIVVYDPAGHTSIGYDKLPDGSPSGRVHHMNMDHSAWEGYEIDGHVDVVISRGSVLVSDGTFHGRAGHGRFLKRGLTQYLS
jgi:dihydropyrimidinase